MRININSALSAAKHAAIITREAGDADDAALDQHLGVAQDMSVLAAAKHHAINDGIIADGDTGAVYIVQSLKTVGEVTLATAIDIARKGEFLD